MQERKSLTRAEKVRALGEQLDGYAAELAEQMRKGKSEGLVRYLEFAASFHHYSFRNIMLILGQFPEATRVAGIRHWNRFGRRVRSGEHGIMILAPMAVWRRSDLAGEPASEDETCESERAETRDKITLFRAVHVFDVSQTEGEGLPEPPGASGDVSVLLPALRRAVGQAGIPIEERAVRGGDGASHGGSISLRPGLPEAQTFAVLVHEWAHEALHWDGERRGKKVEETEADMTAFIVCRHFGVECSSSDYLLCHKVEPEMLLERLERVRGVAARIIDDIEVVMREEVHAEVG